MMYRYGLLLIPILGWSISFEDFSKQVYETTLEKLENDAKIQTAHYSKQIAFSSEPFNIALSSRRIRADDPIANGYEYSIMSEWTFKLPHLKDAQSNEWDVVRKNLESQGTLLRRMIDVDIKHEWLLYEAASQRAAVYAEKVQISEKGYESGKKQLDAGRMSRMELMRLESEYLKAKEELQKAQMEAEHIQHILSEKGMSNEAVRIDNVSFTYIKHYDILNSYIDTSPSIESIEMKISEINAQITTARQSRFESFSVGVGVTQEPTQKSLDFSVNIPISWQEKREAIIASLMHEKSSLEHQKKNRLDKLRLGIEALSKHLKEREEMILQSHEMEKKYEVLFKMGQKAFEGGVISQFEYLASKTEYFNARLRSIDLREEYIDEMYQIESKIGVTIQ